MKVLSVVIPTYNAADSIERLLNSLKRQVLSSGDFEIIIIDDASEDKTTEKIAKWQQKNDQLCRVKVFKNRKNRGNGFTKNKGVRLAEGNFILFIDDHCYLSHRLTLTRFLAFFKKYPADGVCGYYRSSKKGDFNSCRDLRRKYVYKKNKTKELTFENWSTFSIVIGGGSRELFSQVPFPEDFGKHSAEDTWWQLQAVDLGFRLFFTPNIFVFHDHNLSFFDLCKKTWIELAGLGDLIIKSISTKTKLSFDLPSLPYFSSYSLLVLLVIVFSVIAPALVAILVVWLGVSAVRLYFTVSLERTISTWQKVFFALFLPIIEIIKAIYLPLYIILAQKSIYLLLGFYSLAWNWQLRSWFPGWRYYASYR